MNNTNPARTLIMSVVLGVFAMFLIYSYSQDKKAEYDKKFGSKVNVVIAKKDILEMRTIDETMVELQEIPETFRQPGSILDPADVVSLVASAPIKKGEQILETKLLSPGVETGLSNQVAPGKRAVTIPIDESRGVAKLIRPGDRIDIVTAIDSGRGSGSSVSVKTLYQNVTVLATGVFVTNQIPRKLEVAPNGTASFRRLNGDTNFSSVTVEVAPKEAQDLITLMATSPGSIFFTLRNPNDLSQETLNMSSSATLQGRMISSLPMGGPDVMIRQEVGGYTAPTQRLPTAGVAPSVPKKSLPPKRRGPFVEVN